MNRNSNRQNTRLNVEILEDRSVPAGFWPPVSVTTVVEDPMRPMNVVPGQIAVPVSTGTVVNSKGADVFVRNLTVIRNPGSATLTTDVAFARLSFDMNGNGRFEREEVVATAQVKPTAINFALNYWFRIASGTKYQVDVDMQPNAPIGSRFGTQLYSTALWPAWGYHKTQIKRAQSYLHSVAVPDVPAGSLLVTQDAVPVRPQHLLGGVQSDVIMRLALQAFGEDIDVTKLAFSSRDGSASSVERLDLFLDGATTPFATATSAGTGSDDMPSFTFTARMNAQQLVVPKGLVVKVIVKATMKADWMGGIPNQPVQFMLVDDANNQSTGKGSVFARGVASGDLLVSSDQDGVQEEGEISINSSAFGATSPIVGTKHTTVLSKVATISDAYPAGSSQVPTGVADLGMFKFAAAMNVNSQNGYNKVRLEGLIFSVTSNNVAIDADNLVLYNTANSTVTAQGKAYALNGTLLTGIITGPFYIVFTDMWNTSSVNVTIDPNTDLTFAVRGTVTNNKINATQTSELQVSLDTFTDLQKTSFGITGSHVQWLDKDDSSSTTARFFAIDSRETSIRSKRFVS